MTIDLYDQTGKKKGTVDLNAAIFEIKVNEGLIHQALIRQLSNTRKAIAKTKIRSERRGGGRKPWKQKGTGNARAGSRRSPLWRKGGVTFGPTGKENYTKDMPKKQRKKALFCTLSSKAKDNQIIGLESYEATEIKTKTFVELIAKLPGERNYLIVIPEKNLVLQKSARNLPNVKTLIVNYLNIADLLKYETIIFLKESLDKVDEIWGKNAKAPAKEKIPAKKTS